MHSVHTAASGSTSKWSWWSSYHWHVSYVHLMQTESIFLAQGDMFRMFWHIVFLTSIKESMWHFRDNLTLKGLKTFKLGQEAKKQQIKWFPHDFQIEHIDGSPFILFYYRSRNPKVPPDSSTFF